MTRRLRAQRARRQARGLGRNAWVVLLGGLGTLALGGEPEIATAQGLPAAKATKVSTTPALYPQFSPGVHDYVVSCGEEPVEVDVDAARRTKVAVDRRRARSGRFKAGARLAPGQAFELKIETGAEEQAYHVRCLAEDFVGWTWNRHAKPAEKWYLVTPGDPGTTIFFDRRGVPVWWSSSEARPIDAKLLEDGSLAQALTTEIAFGFNPRGRYEVRALDGSLERKITTVGSPTDFHDLEELPNGNVLLLTYRRRDGVDVSAFGGPSNAPVLDAEVQEIDPDGDLVWTWNSKDHVGLEEAARWSPVILTLRFSPEHDVAHINSVEAGGKSIVISLRHTDGVYKIDRSDGSIVWKLGGTSTPESLTVIGDPQSAAMFGGQHDARILADGTLTLHDNATDRGYAPRAVRYRIDEDAGTATLIEEIADPLALTSFCCGSARRSSSGSWLMSWGGVPLVTEFDSSGSRTFSLGFDGGAASYRAFPVADGRIGRSELRRGMEAMNPRSPRGCPLEDSAKFVFGTGAAEKLKGSKKQDVILARGGADTVVGKRRDDCLLGEGGNDVARGKAGDDLIEGGDGRDVLEGQAGADTLKGQRGADLLRGGGGADLLRGGGGADQLRGGRGPDVLDCGGGRDAALGVGRADEVRGNCEKVVRR